MTNHSDKESTLERLLSIAWKGEMNKYHSLLLQEYLRRMALWTTAINVTDNWPYFDVAHHIDPSIRANPDDVERLMQHLSKLHLHHLMVHVLECSLHWDLIKDSNAVKQYGLPSPYEPVIVMFERHGYWHTHHGFTVNSDGSMFVLRSRNDYYQAEPFLESLDNEILDRIDLDNDGREIT